MARIEYVEHRLRNWARWRCMLEDGGGGMSTVDWSTPRVDQSRTGYDAPTVVPISDAEATETNKAVAALVADLRRAVEVVYVETSSTAKAARKLAVAEATVHARIERAHYRLQDWFREQRLAAERERERLAHLQTAARGF